MRTSLSSLLKTILLSFIIQPSSVIADDQVVSREEFKDFTVEIDGRKTCAGLLVAGRKVITAAHCLVNLTPEAVIDIYYGSPQASETGKFSVSGNEVTVHPEFDNAGNDVQIGEEWFKRDIAVINLPVTIPQKDWRPLVSPGEVNRATAGTSLNVNGWGLTTENTLASVQKKMQVRFTGRNPDYGHLQDLFFVERDQGQICPGDSGSAVFTENQIWGLYSVSILSQPPERYDECPESVYQGITDLGIYKEWLIQSLELTGMPNQVIVGAEGGSTLTTERTIDIQNLGTTDLTVTPELISGCGYFEIAGNHCPATLASWESCQIELQFNVNQNELLASCTGQLRINANDSITMKLLVDETALPLPSGGWLTTETSSESGGGSLHWLSIAAFILLRLFRPGH